MHLHKFEQLFFKEEKFYFYFWLFFVLYSVYLNVSWHQWRGHLEDCGLHFDRQNVLRLHNFPVRVKTEVNGTICWFFSSEHDRNATIWGNQSFVNQSFVKPAFQCTHYYSENAMYV